LNDKYSTGYLTLFVNTGDLPITAIIPDASSIAPFELISPAPGPSIPIVKGASLSISVRINAKNPEGKYEKDLIIKLSCQGRAANLTVKLRAEIIQKFCNCLELSPKEINKVSDRNPIGSSREYKNVKIFDNNENCTITIDSIKSLNKLGEWQVTNPTVLNNIKQIINYNESFYMDFKFTPDTTIVQPETFIVYYTVGDTICKDTVILKAKGCKDICPEITINNNTHYFRDAIEQLNNDVRFSKDPSCGGYKNGYKLSIPILLDSEACDEISVDIKIEDKEQSKLATKYFKIQESNIYLLPTNIKDLVVSFQSPSVTEFNKIFTNGLRAKTGTEIDSIFTIKIILHPNKVGCSDQVIIISSKIITAPIRTKPNFVQSYNQLSDIVSTPKKLVCWFDKITGATTTEFIDRTDDGNYPPDQGDFYIDVDDNNPVTPLTKKEPYIKLANKTDNVMNCMKLWRTMTETEFNNVNYVITTLANDYQATPNLFDTGCNSVGVGGDSNPIHTKDVYLFWSLSKGENGVPCYVGLLWVAAKKYGIEDDEYHLSDITFEIIYPIEF